MSDRLYLSCWLRDFRETSMLRDFGKLLELFPFSKLARRGPILRVYGIEHVEPPLLERAFPLDASPAQMIDAAREFGHADCAVEIDAFWDLWSFEEGEWKLAPTPVTLLCLGPEFEGSGDHLRIEFGVDSRFLPIKGVEGSLRMGQSNLKSLLRLVSTVERGLPVENRKLWSESGVNFAELLAETISRYSVN